METVLACPVCGNNISGDMSCTFCNREYTSREGVYILIDSETSGVQWKWDRRIISQKYRDEVKSAYEKMIVPEIREAHRKWWDMTLPALERVSGVVLDMATGLGMMLEQVLQRTKAYAIATDIDPSVLLSTKRAFEKNHIRDAFYLATDLRHIALRQNTVDHITSFGGVNNITDTELVMAELYRVLKPGGSAILMSSFVDEDTPSADLAEDYGFLEAYIHEEFIDLAEETGFEVTDDRLASKVVWKENEMDVFPIDGDLVYYHTVELTK